MQSYLVKSQRVEEKFNSSLSNHVVGVHKSDTLDVLEEISDLGVIHSLSLILSFQQIPTWLHAPIFRILKKDKIVLLPSWWSKILDLIWTYLDLIRSYLDMIWYNFVQVLSFNRFQSCLQLLSPFLVWKIKYHKSSSNLLLGIWC